MTEPIEAIAVGDPRRITEDILSPRFLAMPYASRPRVEVAARPRDRLADIAQRAADHLGFGRESRKRPPSLFGFWRPEDEGAQIAISSLMAVVAEDGLLSWTAPASKVRYREIVRTVDAGALHGDRRRLYFGYQPPLGDGVLPDWQFFLDALETAKQVAEYLAAFGGAAGVLHYFAQRLGPAHSGLRTGSATWRRRGADPFAFDRWLADGSWRPEQLARVLGLSPEETKAVLWVFGFAESPDGTWRPSADPEAELLRVLGKLILNTGYQQGTAEQRRSAVERRLREFGDTGRVQPFDWKELDWLNLGDD
ncbi:MAG: hypothetical protein E6G56_04435 [Actinobacteria bacterium]|nr:MAG: hypothetical protein E6G56_04435 [Actinomycetota bacterium]